MSDNKTHWRKLAPSNYLGAWDVEKDTPVTITSISQEMVKPNAQAPEEECVVMKLKEFRKPMIVNKTNLKSIEKATGTAYIEEWKGKRITLYAKKIRAFGQEMEAIRVRQSAPKPIAKPKLTDKAFDNAYKMLIEGKAKLSDFKKYDLNDNQKETLKEYHNEQNK